MAWVHEVPFGAKVNSEQYITHLSERYLPELRAWYADDTDIHWQQDGAPNHRSKKDYDLPHGPLTGEKSSRYLGPPASPDLNVPDWSVWGQIKRHLEPTTTLAHLRTQLQRVVADLKAQGKLDPAST